MKTFLILLHFISIGLFAQAQNAGKIVGTIKDGDDQKVIDAASVSLLNATDSSLAKSAIADKEGRFVLENIPFGEYIVSAGSIGHKTVFSQKIVLTPSSPAVDCGILQLVPLSKDLSGVTVTSARPFIERQIDKTVVNVDASITTAGKTAMEVLEKSPGVFVDKDGNINLRGKQGVVVMIDDKPTYMSATDLANFLKSMPSSNLDKIEIMTNPSAKYDAAGNAGIINIKTKKIKQRGFNGSLSTSYRQGIYAKTNNSLNLNYRKDKFNLFATLSANFGRNLHDLWINREYYSSAKTLYAIFDQNSHQTGTVKNYNAKVGMDFYSTAKTTFGAVLTGYYIPRTNNGFNKSFLMDQNKTVDSIQTTSSIEKNVWDNYGVNFNFKHSFDTTGREISADMDYLYYGPTSQQFITNTGYDANNVFRYDNILYGNLPSTIEIMTAKTDYSQKIKSVKMDAGLKISHVATVNKADYFDMVSNAKQPDYNKTNHFDYNENIAAAYVNFNRQIKKWGLQLGLRAENTDYNGRVYGNPTKSDSAFSKSYLGLFPTLYLTYAPNDKDQWSFNTGRRINRPDYEDLNPFMYYLDPYTMGAGNPYLRPAYSNTVEVSHTYKNFLTTTLNYSHDKDLIASIFQQRGLVSVQMQGNYGKRDNLGLSISARFPVKKWWNLNLYTADNYQDYKTFINNQNVHMKLNNVFLQAQNQFTFKDDWAAELSGWYGSGFNEGQLIVRHIGQVEAGVSKQVLKKKGTLKLNVSDILKTGNASGYGDFQTAQARFTESSDRRAVTISFNYRFGKPIKGQQQRNTGGANEERSRVKGVN